MSVLSYEVLIALCLICLCVLMFLPIVFHLMRWRTNRIADILSYFDDNAVKTYFEQFRPSQPVKRRTKEDFVKQINQQFSWKLYVPPLLLLFALVATLCIGTERTLTVWFGLRSPGKHLFSGIGIAALAGAAMWIIADELDRLRRRDFTPTDIYNYTFRLLLCIPFGWALAAVVLPSAWLPIAFFMGGFPTTTLFQVARRLGAKGLNLADDAATGQLELEELQSINKTNAERFQSEGINAITQLAYCDPVELTLRTNFGFNYVADCVSGALLWIYFSDKTKTLYSYSFRGAQEVNYFMSVLRNTDQDEVSRAAKAEAERVLNAAADALKIPGSALRAAFEQVADDPYSKFLCDVWH